MFPRKKYEEWKKSQLKAVSLSSYQNDPQLTFIVAEFLNTFPIHEKECYQTAFALTLFHSEISYVEGYACYNGYKLEHAWNCFRNLHFDLSNEIALQNQGYQNYLQLLILPAPIIKALRELNAPIPIPVLYFQQLHEESKI